MSDYAIIVENDESKWNDITGDSYNYPNQYKYILTPGCKAIYYKGKMKNRAFEDKRLSPEPHYFGIAVIGGSVIDPDSEGGERICEVLDYQEFEKAVPFKENGKYLENIPASKATNYWRNGVREIDRSTYDLICSKAKLREKQINLPSENQEFESYEQTEGKKKARYSSYYERKPYYRIRAIEIHGLSCKACGFNFEDEYGAIGKGFIHVHHNKPLSESGPTRINPRTDMTPLCPNCHAMIHRGKKSTLSVDELKEIVARHHNRK